MKNLLPSLFLLLAVVFTACATPEQIDPITRAAAQATVEYREHSARWQQVFMAGNPSSATISIVMAEAEADRRRFESLMAALVENARSLGFANPLQYQQLILEAAALIKRQPISPIVPASSMVPKE